MRPLLCALLAACLALGMEAGFRSDPPRPACCQKACGRCPSGKSGACDSRPCCACCALGATPGAAALPESGIPVVPVAGERRSPEAAWLASRRAYPPPLPPPRLAAV